MCVIFIRNTCTFILQFIGRPYSGLHNNFRKNLVEGDNRNLRKVLCPSSPIFSHMFFMIKFCSSSKASLQTKGNGIVSGGKKKSSIEDRYGSEIVFQ